MGNWIRAGFDRNCGGKIENEPLRVLRQQRDGRVGDSALGGDRVEFIAAAGRLADDAQPVTAGRFA